MDQNCERNLAEFKHDVALIVKSGFRTRDEALSEAVEVADFTCDIDDDAVRAIVDETFEALLEDEKTWPEITDFDRLSAAFDALERRGFVALHNPHSAPSSASYIAEVAHEKSGGATAGKHYAVFYNTQSLERAIEGSGLCIDFMAFPDNPKYVNSHTAWMAAGMMVVEALEAQGLTTEWSGDPSENVLLHMHWQKRHITVPIPAPEEDLLERDKDWTPPADGMIVADAAVVSRLLGLRPDLHDDTVRSVN